MIKLLEKAKKIIAEAFEEGIEFNFDFNIDNSAPMSYADIIYNRIEIARIREEVKELEKAYIREKERRALEDLSSFDEDITKSNGLKYIVTKTSNYDVSFLKQLVDRLLENIGVGFIFIANVNDNNVNFIAKSHKDLSDKIDVGSIIKDASIKSSGNGGGSKTFGQGGGTDISKLDKILTDIKKSLK
jgi:alanyl-tRNA synthetase